MKESNKRPGETYSVEEINLLIAACGRRYPTGIRNAGLIAVLYGSGLRISEALLLMPSDLDLKNGMIKVRHGKGDESRTVTIALDCQKTLEIWLERRKAMGFNGREPVFCGISKNAWGTSIKDAYIRAMLPRLGKKAGLEKRIHAHGFRHSLATQMELQGRRLAQISEQLGHSSVAITDKYIRKLGSKENSEAVRTLNLLGNFQSRTNNKL